jgi:hypothetical protein
VGTAPSVERDERHYVEAHHVEPTAEELVGVEPTTSNAIAEELPPVPPPFAFGREIHDGRRCARLRSREELADRLVRHAGSPEVPGRERGAQVTVAVRQHGGAV